jgi:hypothetical protein
VKGVVGEASQHGKCADQRTFHVVRACKKSWCEDEWVTAPRGHCAGIASVTVAGEMISILRCRQCVYTAHRAMSQRSELNQMNPSSSPHLERGGVGEGLRECGCH